MTKRMKGFKQRLRENEKKMGAVYAAGNAEARKERDQEKVLACLEFIRRLSDILGGSYELIGSCNKDISRYLIPKGTEEQLTYYGKPEKSFRLSDHWSWYSSDKKCSDPDYIQCESVDMPRVRMRKNIGEPTRPRHGVQVAIQLGDGRYHHVFGEKWDQVKKTFSWVETDPMDICRKYSLV